MQKILYLIPRFSTGGAERLVLQYAKYFKEQGNEVVVASVLGGGELIPEFQKAGIEIFIGRQKNLLNLLSNLRAIKKMARKFQPSIIHSHIFSADLMGYILKNSLSTKWFSTLHNVEWQASAWRKVIWQLILKRADKVVAVGEAVYQFSKNEFKLSETKLVKILNGIPLASFLALDNSSLLKSNQLRLAVIGRLEKQKGQQYLLQALAQLPKNIVWHLQVMGEGTKEKELKLLAENLHIAKNISWLGVINNVAEKLANVDVVVQPSLWEGLSLSIMEAMAGGRIVITTRAGGEELIKHCETGLIVPEVDHSSLAELLSLVWEEKEKYCLVGNRAREYAKNNFSIENNLREIAGLYGK